MVMKIELVLVVVILERVKDAFLSMNLCRHALTVTLTSFHCYEILKETAMTRGQEDEVSSFGSTPAEHVLTPNIIPGSTNTSRPAREELLPQSASRGK